MTTFSVGDILNPAGYTPEQVFERLQSLPIGTVVVDQKTGETITKNDEDLYEVKVRGQRDNPIIGYPLQDSFETALKIARVGIQELLNAPVYKIERLPKPLPKEKPYTTLKKQRVPIMSNVEFVGDDEEPALRGRSLTTYLVERGKWTSTTRFTIDMQEIAEETATRLEHMPIGPTRILGSGLVFRRAAVDRYEIRSTIDTTKPPLFSGTARDLAEIAISEALQRIGRDPMEELVNLLPTVHELKRASVRSSEREQS